MGWVAFGFDSGGKCEKVPYKFHCPPLSGVSCYWIVVVRFDNVEPELIVLGDIDLSSVEY